MKFEKLCIIGCGDIGFRVARLALDRGVRVTAVSRGEKVLPDTDKSGIEILTANLDNPETLLQLDLRDTAVLYTAPPPGGGLIDNRVRNFLAAAGSRAEPVKIVYISTTGVYGTCGEELVDETRPVQPTNHPARRRLDAEEQLAAWCKNRGIPLVILRVAGIYGPGRIPLQRIHNREPLLDARVSGYTNRIHADDLAQVCLAALERGEDGDVFNVSDGEISRMNDYFNAITDLLGLERLPEVGLDEARKVMTPLMFGYMTESRQICNKRMLEKLGVKLQYPTLAAGLKNALGLEG